MKRFALPALLLFAATGLAFVDDDFRREGEGDVRAKKDELEKKAPPELFVDGWENTEGKPLKLSDLKGKVVVLDFWGTWCGPCRAAMPHLKELYAKHKENGLVVIGVHTTNGGEEMAAYVKEQELPWPVAIDVEKKTVTAFRVDSYPDYYVIDRAGKLRVADLANAELDRVVEFLLAEKPEAAAETPK